MSEQPHPITFVYPITTGQTDARAQIIPPVVAGSIAANRARYLSGLTLDELAQHAGALAAECHMRGIPVAVELGTVQARIEARAETERTVAMIAACGHGQAGEGAGPGGVQVNETGDSPVVLPSSDAGIDGAYPLPPVTP